MTHHLNRNNNNHHPIAAAIAIFTLTIIATASSMATVPAVATATTEATTTPSAPSSEIQLSPEPVYQELRRPISNIPLNETHLSVTYSGNGTLTLPDTGETINTTSNGTVLVSFMTQSAVGSETLRTENGEIATVTIHEIIPFDPVATNGEARGITIAAIHTESTDGGGMLAPLNGMILVGTDEILPNEDSHLTLREWQRGTTIVATTTPPSEEQTTNAADPNATLLAEQEGEQQQEEDEGEQELLQQPSR